MLPHPSHIREIIVKMMTKASGLESTLGLDHARENGGSPQGDFTSSCIAWGLSGHVTGSSACILWSAVALGALVKGAPFEEVILVELLNHRVFVMILLESSRVLPFRHFKP